MEKKQAFMGVYSVDNQNMQGTPLLDEACHPAAASCPPHSISWSLLSGRLTTPSQQQHATSASDWRKSGSQFQTRMTDALSTELNPILAAMASRDDHTGEWHYYPWRTVDDITVCNHVNTSPFTNIKFQKWHATLGSSPIEGSLSAACGPPAVLRCSRICTPVSHSYHQRDYHEGGILEQLEGRGSGRLLFEELLVNRALDYVTPSRCTTISTFSNLQQMTGVANTYSTTNSSGASVTEAAAKKDTRGANPDKKKSQFQRQMFPALLHRALAELDHVGDATNIAAFLPDGNGFQIKDQMLFEKQIIPVFFPKMKNFASFQRQLNLYNFKRIGGAGVDRGAYRHAMFHRDYPALAYMVKRNKVKS